MFFLKQLKLIVVKTWNSMTFFKIVFTSTLSVSNIFCDHSKPEMSVGYAKMNQANDYQSNLDHQWAYQMPLKTRKSNKPFLKKSQFSIFLRQNRAIKSKKSYI